MNERVAGGLILRDGELLTPYGQEYMSRWAEARGGWKAIIESGIGRSPLLRWAEAHGRSF